MPGISETLFSSLYNPARLIPLFPAYKMRKLRFKVAKELNLVSKLIKTAKPFMYISYLVFLLPLFFFNGLQNFLSLSDSSFLNPTPDHN